MLGGKNFHKLIEDELVKISKKLALSYDSNGIHVLEITRCSRLSYFERMDPFVDEFSNALTNIFKSSLTMFLNGITREYKVDDLAIYATVDLIIDNDMIINFVPVSIIPEYPACLFSTFKAVSLFTLHLKANFLNSVFQKVKECLSKL